MASTCGQAMDVPDRILYLADLLSRKSPAGEAAGEYAANIATPGALRSGCIDRGIRLRNNMKQGNFETVLMYLLFSGIRGSGPLEEKEATIGAKGSFIASLLNMLA